jgi:hypothetical protein
MNAQPENTRLPKVCIVGAGCSGFTTAKRLKDYGIPFDCYEMSDDIGGNWYYKNPNGASACYESLHIDTSKWRLAFEDFPIPEDFPDFPHHAQLQQYFKDYVAHFGLRPYITFNTEVRQAKRTDDGLWAVTLSTGETKLYDALVVANGHHWDPRMPEFPGAFDGDEMHVHAYCDPFDPIDMRGKNIVVVGMGNSAMDVACELSQKPIAKRLMMAARRGVYVIPKYHKGEPLDKASAPAWMPLKLQKALGRYAVKKIIGDQTRLGMPQPDHRPLDAHPTVSSEFAIRLGSGDIEIKPNIEAKLGNQVRFTDGSVEDVDVIIYATGYNVSFPFLKDETVKVENNHVSLFKRMMRPGVPNLFFMGLAQALPTLVNFAEQQSKLVAKYLAGEYALPSEEEMWRMTKADEALYTGNFYNSARHTMQLDFPHYVRQLMKEIAKGEARAKKQGGKLPVPARAGSVKQEAA